MEIIHTNVIVIKVFADVHRVGRKLNGNAFFFTMPGNKERFSNARRQRADKIDPCHSRFGDKAVYQSTSSRRNCALMRHAPSCIRHRRHSSPLCWKYANQMQIGIT